MGQIIDLNLSFRNLINFAEKALKKGDTLGCALNLNEALELAEAREEKQQVYSLFIKCFRSTSNVRSVMDVVAKDVENRVNDDYYRMDFDLRRHTPDEEFFESEEPDYDVVRTYNEIKNFINERKYDDAIALLSDAKPNYECMDAVVDALNDAVDCDKRLNLDKYLIPLIGIMANSPCQIDMLQLLLEGGKATHNIMVDSAEFLLSEEDDSNTLCLMGIAYFQSNELETAEKFFLKALDNDPIDEDALYYMSVISNLLGGEKRNGKYWDRYKAVYKITEPPINLLEEFFFSEDKTFLVPYQTLPISFIEKVAKRLLLEASTEDISDEYAAKLTEFAKLSPDKPFLTLIKFFGRTGTKPRLQKLYVDLLKSSRVPAFVKERLVGILAEDGYEGDLLILTDKRVVFTRFAKLHRRVSKAWSLIYKLLLRSMPFSDVYIPVRCGVLSQVIKKLDGMIALEEDDMGFALALALVNYLRRLRVNIDILSLIKAMNIDADLVDKGLTKFGLDTIYV